MSRKSREAVQGYIYILPSFIILLVFYIVPIFMSGFYSFTSYSLVKAPRFVGFHNYLKMLNDSYVLAAIQNTFLYTLITVPLQTILALLFAAFIATRLRNKFGEFVRSSMFIPVIASAVACGAIWSVLMDTDNGLLNTILEFFGLQGINWLGSTQYALLSVCIVSIWKNVGYFLVIYYAGIMGIPGDLFEAAEIDGATKWQTFRLITIPMLRPVTYLIVTLGIIWSFQVFDLSYVMTGGGPGKATVTLVMDIYNQAFKGNGKMGYASAIAMILLIFIIIVNIVEDRFFKPKEEI